MNDIPLDFKLAAMLEKAAELGALKVLKEAGLIKQYMSRNEAAKVYGRTQVDRWIKYGKITPMNVLPGRMLRLDRVRLAALSASEELVRFVSIERDY